MAMSKKDYVAIAAAIHEVHKHRSGKPDFRQAAVEITNQLLPHLRSTDPAFNDAAFIEACGLKVTRFAGERFALIA
jgi:hypothetical protein